jgi:hypothetical protein
MGAAACGEVTRLNCDRQFKPLVYLNGGMGGKTHPDRRDGLDPAIPITLRKIPFEDGSLSGVTTEIKTKAPPHGGAFAARFRFELAISLRIGILPLTARILLLLARLLAAALLLAGLLARVLILLARVLVGVGHSEPPLLNVRETAGKSGASFAGTPVPPRSLRGLDLSPLRLWNSEAGTSSVQAP